MPADGCGSPRNRPDAQGQFRCQERVRNDPELQSPSGCFQQTQNYQGLPYFSLIRVLIRSHVIIG